jgi:hypothetical protein
MPKKCCASVCIVGESMRCFFILQGVKFLSSSKFGKVSVVGRAFLVVS